MTGTSGLGHYRQQVSIHCSFNGALSSMLLRPPTRMLLLFELNYKHKKKREIRTLLLISCSWPSNLPSQKDKQLRSPRRYEYSINPIGNIIDTLDIYYPQKDAYRHIPRTSTVASSLLRVRSVRSSEPSDERHSKRLFYKM